jgi:hemolysin D
MADELAFLPAALSLQDTPVHPAPRRLAWGLIVLFTVGVVWATFGQVDIVAVAPGRIIVGERTKTIQPLDASVVRRILVRDGDHVKAGQILIELDPTMANADKANIQEQFNAAVSEEQRTAALLSALNSGAAPSLAIDSAKDAVGRAEAAAVRAQLASEWQDINAKLAKFEAEAVRHRAEIATVRESIAKLEATVPMAQTREADFKKLVLEGFISSHATQDKTRERVELERDLATTRARLLEAQSTLKETEQARASYKAETQRLLSDRNAIAASKHLQLTQDHAKATQRERLTQLTAPVDGVIQQLAVFTSGGVVTSAQPLMIVVPESDQVSAEVNVANLDIGFVNVGQRAEIKLETFPYTRYGTVGATVSNVTADAVTDEKKGSYYPAILKLSEIEMNIDGKRIRLTPGMNVTAEIKTGQRSVIEYLLSPIQKAGTESLKER